MILKKSRSFRYESLIVFFINENKNLLFFNLNICYDQNKGLFEILFSFIEDRRVGFVNSVLRAEKKGEMRTSDWSDSSKKIQKLDPKI